MEAILKRTIRSGNASAVVLPKTWLDKRVRIELVDMTYEAILYDILDILKSTMSLSEIIGIYLVGSYARKDQTDESDIDILVISEKTDKETIKKDNYEIMIVSLGLLNYKLKENLFPIGSMLKEANPLLNSNFLNEIKIEVTKKNIKWYLETTKDQLKKVKSSIDLIESKKPDGKLSDAVAYSLILRLRTLYAIDCLINNKQYSKSEFIKLTKDISGSLTAYNQYLYAKSHDENKRELPLNEGKKLYLYVKDYLEKVTHSVKS